MTLCQINRRHSIFSRRRNSPLLSAADAEGQIPAVEAKCRTAISREKWRVGNTGLTGLNPTR
jgi:hypothetical protein